MTAVSAGGVGLQLRASRLAKHVVTSVPVHEMWPRPCAG
jgi:hypothetical protein